MKHNNAHKSHFPLTPEGTDAASAQLADLLADVTDRKEGLRTRLAAEEVLLYWGQLLGADTRCTLCCNTRFGQQSIRLSAPGPSADPSTRPEESELEAAGNVILERLGLAPVFRYEKGINIVTFQLHRKRPNQLVWISLAALLALILGLLSLWLPAGAQTLLSQGLATPALQMLLGALTGVAMPMVFLSICTSIMDIGDMATLGKLGKRLLMRFLMLTLGASVLTVVAIGWLFPISPGSSQGSFGLQSILSMVFDAVPSDIVSPIISGNTLQLIFLGGCVGVAILCLGERARQAADTLRQFDRVVGFLMGGINRLIPVFVFLTFFTLVTSGTITKVGGAVKIILFTLLLCLLIVLVATGSMRLRFRVPLRLLLQKMGPAFVVALTTASSAASYPIRLETCEKRLGMDGHTARFAIPLAQALFKPCTSAAFCVAAFCLAEEYGVPITPGWLVLLVVVSALLAVAAPPIPGGTKIGYSALLLQLGIPAEGLVLVMASDAVLDFFFTATNTYAQMALTALCADRLGMLARDVLAAPGQPVPVRTGRQTK